MRYHSSPSKSKCLILERLSSERLENNLKDRVKDIQNKGNTKKECIENAIKNIPMVNEAWRSKQSYGDLVEEFKRLKAEKGIFN